MDHLAGQSGRDSGEVRAVTSLVYQVEAIVITRRAMDSHHDNHDVGRATCCVVPCITLCCGEYDRTSCLSLG
eukprot:54213-Eustigmatos_ZCMA.PRE.1